MSTYRLIRDKEIYSIPENLIEVCDNRFEIIQFGIKEIINLALELQETDFRDLDAIADIIELIYQLSEISFISSEQIDAHVLQKLNKLGGYSKYLKRKEDSL